MTSLINRLKRVVFYVKKGFNIYRYKFRYLVKKYILFPLSYKKPYFNRWE